MSENPKKERKQPKLVQALLPVMAKSKDANFAKVAVNFGYTTEIVFTLITCLVLIEILVSNKSALIFAHSLRATFLFIIAGLTLMSISKGHNIIEINTIFYIIEYIIVVGILTPSLLLSLLL